MNHLRYVLDEVGYSPRTITMADGSRLLVLPHGGRVLGLYTAACEKNFYWTSPAVKTVALARDFLRTDAWHNSGGDRTWLAPETDIFFPGFPDLDRYEPPPALDPGTYSVVETASGFRLACRLSLRLARQRKDVSLSIDKWFRAALNPLRHERGIDLTDVTYAGYTQKVRLAVTSDTPPSRARIGLWNILQLPHGGEALFPTFSRAEPTVIFSHSGMIAPEDLTVSKRLVCFRMRQTGEHKISMRASVMTGRAAYYHRRGNQADLVIRNFCVNPSGEYVDTPWNDPNWLGFAVQACNVNGPAGVFSELEYHVPTVCGATTPKICTDRSQVWAFRGPEAQVSRIRSLLVAG